MRPARQRPLRRLVVLAASGSLITLSAVAAGPAATATATARATIGARPALPPGAQVTGALPASRSVMVDVVLDVADPVALADFVHSVSTPGSPGFRHFLAPGQFAARFGPPPAAAAAVRAWLSTTGLTVGPTTPDGLVVPVTGPAPLVGQVFGTTLASVRLSSGRDAYAATTAPSVPAPLAGQIDTLIGLNDLTAWHNNLAQPPAAARRPALSGPGSGTSPQGAPGPPSRPGATAALNTPLACPAAASLASPGGSLTQNQLAGIYGLSPLYAQGRGGGGITIALYELEPHLASDVAAFDQCYGIANPISTVQVDGGAGTGVGSGEAALDIEDASSLAPQAKILVYEGPNSNDNLPGAGPFDTLERIATDDAAQIVSTSWGQCESANVPTGTGAGSAAGAEAVVFAEMAAQGQTVVAASGDSGSEGCWDTEGGQDDTDTSLQAEDPASQPDVTGVGGTTLPTGSTVGERVWNDCQGVGSDACALGGEGASGGGISTNWAMPTWQQEAGNGTVNTFSSGGPCGNGGGYCRQVPDVAAAADPNSSYIFYWSGGWGQVGGTSGAAPLWGALFALSAGGCAAPLGLANPSLYSLGSVGSQAFHDVTVAGDNNLTGPLPNAGHYPTTVGYDMATGWGSPDGEILAGALQPIGGCPAVIALSAGNGPVTGGGTLTIVGSSLQGATAVHFGAGLSAPILSDSPGAVTVAIPGAPGPLAVDVTVTTPNGTSAAVPQDRYIFGTPRTGLGYWLAAGDGGIFAFGNAGFYGSMGGQHLDAPVVAMTATPDDRGYWEVAADGGIFAFGNAGFYGSMGGRALDRPIVGIAGTPDGGGYWEVAADGGIFAFGNAQFYGSMGGRALNEPIVGLAPTLDGGGYWEVASDGGLFSFGDAQFYGSMGGRPLNRPIVGMAGTPDAAGYWEVASDGGLFSFGDANFFGSTGAIHLVAPIVSMSET